MQQNQCRSKNQKYSVVVLCRAMVLRTSLQGSLVCNCRGILGFLLSWHSADTGCWHEQHRENPGEKIVEIVQCRRHHHQEAESRRKLDYVRGPSTSFSDGAVASSGSYSDSDYFKMLVFYHPGDLGCHAPTAQHDPANVSSLEKEVRKGGWILEKTF